MKNIKSFVLLIIFIAVLLNSCATHDNGVEPINKKQTIKTNQSPTSAKIVIETDTVFINDSVGISCIVEDPDDNESFSFEWASFKVSENSTEEDYDYNYWMNNGKFIRGGTNALWTPGMATGKYIIFCNAKDKAGEQLFTTKIINVSLGAGITALTDSLVYHDRVYTFITRIYNYTNDTLEIYHCPGIERLYETSKSNYWIEYELTSPQECNIDVAPYVAPNSNISIETLAPYEPGIYRGKIEYEKLDGKIVPEYIYSSEFEVKKY